MNGSHESLRAYTYTILNNVNNMSMMSIMKTVA